MSYGYNWNSIKKIRRSAQALLMINLVVGCVLLSSYRKPQRKKAATSIDGKSGHIHARRGVKLRYQPKPNSKASTSIPNGELVEIINDTSTVNKGWVEVAYQGSTGWVLGGSTLSKCFMHWCSAYTVKTVTMANPLLAIFTSSKFTISFSNTVHELYK